MERNMNYQNVHRPKTFIWYKGNPTLLYTSYVEEAWSTGSNCITKPPNSFTEMNLFGLLYRTIRQKTSPYSIL